METPDMASGNGPDVPVRLVTVNQVVAWNIAWHRHEAGLTQEQLGDLLGWPQNKVSEAERSWNGKRTREFDAETLLALAMALDVPLIAFFLPPLGDGTDATYVIRPPGLEEDCGMADLIAAALPDSHSAGNAMASYRQRLLGATGKYLGENWREEVARWLRRSEGLDALLERAFRLRGERARLLATADELGEWAAAMEKVAEEEDEE